MTCRGCKFDAIAPRIFCVNALNCSYAPDFSRHVQEDVQLPSGNRFEEFLSRDEARNIIRAMAFAMGMPSDCSEEQFYSRFGDLLALNARERIIVSSPIRLLGPKR